MRTVPWDPARAGVGDQTLPNRLTPLRGPPDPRVVRAAQVNVFAGLGIPWTLAAAYWAVVGPSEEWLARYGSRGNAAAFVVPAGSLGFSVLVFTVAAVVAVGLLQARRRFEFFGRAELGGPSGPRRATAAAFLAMWVVYISLASLRELDALPPPPRHRGKDGQGRQARN